MVLKQCLTSLESPAAAVSGMSWPLSRPKCPSPACQATTPRPHACLPRNTIAGSTAKHAKLGLCNVTPIKHAESALAANGIRSSTDTSGHRPTRTAMAKNGSWIIVSFIASCPRTLKHASPVVTVASALASLLPPNYLMRVQRQSPAMFLIPVVILVLAADVHESCG